MTSFHIMKIIDKILAKLLRFESDQQVLLRYCSITTRSPTTHCLVIQVQLGVKVTGNTLFPNVRLLPNILTLYIEH